MSRCFRSPEERNTPMAGCGHVEPRLRALVDGELGTGEQARVLAHLDTCARCRASYARVQAVVSALQEQPLEDVPAHFSASLQVRLARHRAARAEKLQRRKPRLPAWLTAPVRARWATAFGAVLATLALFVAFQQKSAAEVVREAEQSWRRIQNYGCVFESQGVYQGLPRSFEQHQFYRRLASGGAEFMLETRQDYPLTTYVKEDRVIQV